ncbi:response regulator transcription factor [Desulfitobacterium sp.]|uniref:response regulator n=1 Tax=Desulfitobacterium sp. TaxID=49981 RepID=UPI002CDD5214|nr:response regulator transcription factor [Desulfitobacterium sp.]HVJ49729.1 response regulator transcription factor [Desulfitobacterium sp.]
MKPIKVLLVDDHKLFREGIKALLELRDDIEIIGEASNGEEAIVQARRFQPEMILMDIRMPVMGGVDAIKAIKLELPWIQIVALTVSDEDSDLIGAIKAGAQGYILKNTSSDDLVRQLKGVRAGESALSGLMATKILAEFNNALITPKVLERVERDQALLIVKWKYCN